MPQEAHNESFVRLDSSHELAYKERFLLMWFCPRIKEKQPAKVPEKVGGASLMLWYRSRKSVQALFKSNLPLQLCRESHSVVQAGLELTAVLLAQSPEYWELPMCTFPSFLAFFMTRFLFQEVLLLARGQQYVYRKLGIREAGELTHTRLDHRWPESSDRNSKIA